jgi:hypothetical protein
MGVTALGAIRAKGTLGARVRFPERRASALPAMVRRDDEQKAGEHDVEHYGNRISPQQCVSHNHADRIDPTDNPERRCEEPLSTDEVAVRSRKLHTYRREYAENQNLRRQQQRIRQQA